MTDLELPVLIVDDQPAVVQALEILCELHDLPCVSASSPAAAKAIASDRPLGAVLQDMNFSRKTTGEEGLELLDAIKARRPELPVILITAWGSIELAVRGMRGGAADFITMSASFIFQIRPMAPANAIT